MSVLLLACHICAWHRKIPVLVRSLNLILFPAEGNRAGLPTQEKFLILLFTMQQISSKTNCWLDYQPLFGKGEERRPHTRERRKSSLNELGCSNLIGFQRLITITLHVLNSFLASHQCKVELRKFWEVTVRYNNRGKRRSKHIEVYVSHLRRDLLQINWIT